ncbi:DUF2218 domain-containing protein [Arthrobacter bambusae]|uniref:DUF2218 domain-containing protein n=1 Tax=Arthrobacter bambusae TaxID=1338426 RepID=UPI001F5065DA|nr:DUF2218 domain-containing protein [Arthrobacter bambusae]MCI0143897.1 DUF2218 domain-containing protein [Arthrobacter bambusae]
MTEPTSASHSSCAVVSTDTAARFAKQFASHFGRKTEVGLENGREAEVRPESDGPRLVLAFGSCLLVPRNEALELYAEADTTAGLERVQNVVGSHLEQFGQRQGLSIHWSPSAYTGSIG